MEIGVFRDWRGGKQRIATLSREGGVGSERFQYCEAFVEHGVLGVSEMLRASHMIRGRLLHFFRGYYRRARLLLALLRRGKFRVTIGLLSLECLDARALARSLLRQGSCRTSTPLAIMSP